jgi:hypothetical protein
MRQEIVRSFVRSAPGMGPESDALKQRRMRRIEAFASSARPAIAKLAIKASALEDLADSFPGLLFALATGYGSETDRRAATTAVLEGIPLREAANRLGLPFWLRKLPAASFNGPLLDPPSDPQLVGRLMTLIPRTPRCAAAWLGRLLAAHHAGRPELALWVAAQYRAAQPSPRSESFLTVLAWAWFSTADPGLRGSQLLTTKWKPSMGARRAAAEARLWRERIALDVCLGSGLTDTWIAEGTVGDLSFVALRNADDFIAESIAMDNCLDRYADRLIGRAARVFSIRRDGRSIANVEIAAHERETGHPMIAQLRGPHNRRAALDVWQAAYMWLGSQPLRLADKKLRVRIGPAAKVRRSSAIWKPFLDALPQQGQDAATAALFGGGGGSRARPAPGS